MRPSKCSIVTPSFLRVAAAMLPPLVLGACSTLDQAVADMFASKTRAVGLYAGQVLQGQISFTSARAGALELRSGEPAPVSCLGTVRYTASTSAAATLSCSDGASILIPLQVLGPLRGTGRSEPGATGFALTYGLQLESVAAYLGLSLEQVRPVLP